MWQISAPFLLRLMHIAIKRVKCSRILAITITRKAANEMVCRLIQRKSTHTV